MKQDCTLFTFSKGTFPHTEIQWCVYNFIWQQCQKQKCMDVNPGHSVFIPFPLLPHLPGLSSLWWIPGGEPFWKPHYDLRPFSSPYALCPPTPTPAMPRRIFFNLVFWIGNTFTFQTLKLQKAVKQKTVFHHTPLHLGPFFLNKQALFLLFYPVRYIYA